MSEELKEVEEELRKVLDESFKSYMAMGMWLIESNEKMLEFAKEIEHMFKYRLRDVTSIEDLKTIGIFLTVLAQQQLRLAKLHYKTMVEFKEASFYLMYLPFYTTLKFAEKTFPSIGERLNIVEKEMERLKKLKKEIKLEAPKDIIETIKAIQKQIERAKKAQGQYRV